MRPRRIDDELEALDPVTGSTVGAGALGDRGARPTASDTDRQRLRLRRIRMLCLLLAATCASAAAYAGVVIDATRRIERTWRTAMAIDAVRAEADRRILDELQRVGEDDGDAADALLTGPGVAARRALATAERSLTDQPIADDRTSEVRDRMIEALQFRQLQMSPGRRRLGDTPLVLAEAALDRHLRRWRLPPTTVPRPRLAAAEQSLARVRKFTDDPTGAVVVALDDGAMVTADLDAGTVTRRALPALAERLIPVGADTVVVSGLDRTLAYGLADPATAGPRWERPDASAFAVPHDDGLWLVEGASVRRVGPDGGDVAGPFPLPARTSVVGALGDGLVLLPASAPAERRVELWDPRTGATTVLAQPIVRFVGAGRTLAVVEGPVTLDEASRTVGVRPSEAVRTVDSSGATLQLLTLPASAGAMVERPGGREVAMSVGPLAGRIASVVRAGPGVRAGRGGTGEVQPLAGPRAAIQPGALGWSPSGRLLFWVTPDGGLAMHRLADRRSSIVRAPVSGLHQVVVFEAQR